MEAMYTSVVMLREWHVMYTGLSTQLHKNRLVPLAIYGFVFLGGPNPSSLWLAFNTYITSCFAIFLPILPGLLDEADKALYIVLFMSTHFEVFSSLQKKILGCGGRGGWHLNFYFDYSLYAKVIYLGTYRVKLYFPKKIPTPFYRVL